MLYYKIVHFGLKIQSSDVFFTKSVKSGKKNVLTIELFKE